MRGCPRRGPVVRGFLVLLLPAHDIFQQLQVIDRHHG